MSLYDDYYYEEDCKSEADTIVEEAVSKLQALIEKSAKAQIDSIEESRDREFQAHQNTLKNLREAQDMIKQRDQEIKNLESKLVKVEETGFKDLVPLNTKVYVVFPNFHSSVQVTCPVCNGSRSITKDIDGVEYKASCPKCSYSVNDPFEASVSVPRYYVETQFVSGYSIEVNHKGEKTIKYYVNQNETTASWFNKSYNTEVKDITRMFLDKEKADKHAKELFNNAMLEARKKTGNTVEESTVS